MNRALTEEVETVFLTPTDMYTYISSTLVREVAQLGGDVSGFVSPQVKAAIEERWQAVTSGLATLAVVGRALSLDD